ncbi:hypothetical protein [Citrifermentans bremense]|uniref:hypothetical protein n=1 Tax=Citrifermentans bremense TaxID=60035 RepID=UPI0012EBA4ED|nr:hypothetical protein [Citrifermentans bremense]
MRRIKATFVSAAILTLTLAGCGGGGGSSAPTVSGVAATGMPMSGTVFLKDSANSETNTTINPQTGSFSFNVSGKTPPFMLRAGALYSMSAGAGTANINPATTLMVANMGSFNNMSSLNSFYRSPNSTTMVSMMASEPASYQQFQQKMVPLLNQYGATNMDPMTGSFTIGQGLDKMFDDVKMTIDHNGNVSMIYANGTAVFTGPMGNMAAGTMMSGNIVTPGTAPTSSAIAVSPSTIRLQVGGAQQFTASVPVTWSVITANGGSISSTGLYKAPSSAGIFMVKATSIADPTKSTTVMIQVGNTGMVMMKMS